MKHVTLFVIYIFLMAVNSFSQPSTEFFETENHGSSSFTDNGVVFNIISHVGTFDIQANYPGTGWSGLNIDNRYIDNSSAVENNASFSIKTTSNFFKVSRFWIFLSNNLLNQNVQGSLTVTGKLSGIIKFTQTKTSGFATSLGSTNGYTLIDLTNLNGRNYSNILMDELQLTIGGDYTYAGLDAFTWVKDQASLPVWFGAISAKIIHSKLNVQWETFQEKNNDHFEIEVSDDGKKFTNIAVIQSRTMDGNSDHTLTYEWNAGSTIALSLLPLLSLLLAPVAIFNKKIKSFLIGSMALLIFIMPGCKKGVTEISPAKDSYLRIVQIDKDGNKSYSKVVKIIKE